jgi:hypothetical protein
MTSKPTEAEPRKRNGPGCLLIVALVVVGLIVGFLVFTFTRLTDEQKVARCPEVTLTLVEERLGEPTSFVTTETTPGNQVKGTTMVGGSVYEWTCGIGITRGDRVQVDVRDADFASVISEYVDL